LFTNDVDRPPLPVKAAKSPVSRSALTGTRQLQPGPSPLQAPLDLQAARSSADSGMRIASSTLIQRLKVGNRSRGCDPARLLLEGRANWSLGSALLHRQNNCLLLPSHRIHSVFLISLLPLGSIPRVITTTVVPLHLSLWLSSDVNPLLRSA
jgi:hypothetical protein